MTYDPTKSLGERLHISYRSALGHDDKSIFNQLPAGDQSFWEHAALNFVARLSDAPAQAGVNDLRPGLTQAVWTLRNAANVHEADAALSKKVAESGGHAFTARVLRSYANGLEMDANR